MLIAQENLDGVAALVAEIGVLPVRTGAELEKVVALLLEARYRGMAEVAIERFSRSVPNSTDARLFQAEGLLKLGRLPAVIALMDTIVPLIRDECVRAGAIWMQLGRHPQALAAYQAGIGLAPEDLDCWRGLVEAAALANQPRVVKHGLAQLVTRLPDRPYWWAFIADHASRVGDAKLARRATEHAEMLPIPDAFTRLLLARAYGKMRRLDDVRRQLGSATLQNFLQTLC
jgi:tetratricopeptide (TPR) repeat protein